jgi:TBC1 domain family member 25
MYGGHERRGAKPISQSDFRAFLDREGRLVDANGLRQAIYENGIDPSMRKLAWRYLLNVCPTHLTSFEHIAYLNDIAVKYDK